MLKKTLLGLRFIGFEEQAINILLNKVKIGLIILLRYLINWHLMVVQQSALRPQKEKS